MNYKIVCAFLAGLGIGGTGGYFAAKKILQKKNDKILQDATDKASAAYSEAVKDMQDKLRAEAEAWKKEYASQSEDPVTPEDFEKGLEKIEEAPAPEENERSEMDIYAISIANFMQDARYEKKYLTYHREDDMLVNDSEEEVDRFEAIGDMADLLPDYGGNVMYIRNEEEAVDYQVDFSDSAFGGGET